MPVITISRGTRSGGVALAKKLAERLNYPLLSREILVEGARKYNILVEELREDFEKIPGRLQRFTRARNRYVVFVKAALLEAATRDNLIYHGNAGQILLAGIPHVLKIRLVAPFERRISTVMAEEQVDRTRAEQLVREADAERERWLRVVYQTDWQDPTVFDVILNLETMSMNTAAELVVRAALSKEFQADVASTRRLANLLLESEVEAAFAADDKLFDQGLSVTAANGTVTVRGQVKNQKFEELISSTVSQVKGVKKHNLYLRVLSDGFSR